MINLCQQLGAKEVATNMMNLEHIKTEHKESLIWSINFSPICNPLNCAWGQKAFNAYLGPKTDTWSEYDSSWLMARSPQGKQTPALVDQGDADNFLMEQLKPEALQSAAKKSNYPLTLRMQPGYDHSYFFISSFIDDHLQFHAQYLL